MVIAACLGAYMALNIGANDVANNMGPAVGANALTMGGAIAIAVVFESAGALIAGGDVVSTIAKGIIAPESMGTASVFIWAMMAALVVGGTLGKPCHMGRRTCFDDTFGGGRRHGRGHRSGRICRSQLVHDGRDRRQLGDFTRSWVAQSQPCSCG